MRELAHVSWTWTYELKLGAPSAGSMLGYLMGNVFARAVYEKHQRGVAILLNRRWANSLLNSVAVND
eukprot:5039644-Pyramimonas_sp.AAC.1